jgi:hypothetical protein
MRLATLRSVGRPRMLRRVEDFEDFEQEIVDVLTPGFPHFLPE